MACKSKSTVYLGYEDAVVTEKDRSSVNFKTNKIGGKPDLPSKNVSLPSPICKLCGLHQILAVQVYAPLDNSMYHRTLYVFTCINPNCWNQHESWTCLRVQSLEDKLINNTTGTISPSFTTITSSARDWLSSADDWGIDENITDDNNTNNINNNNIPTINNNHNTIIYNNTKSCVNDIENKLTDDLSNMCFNDDTKKNNLTRVKTPILCDNDNNVKTNEASAEIEDEESEVIFIDTPTQPQCNLIDLIQQNTPNLFKHHGSKSHIDLTFNELFMVVYEEELTKNVSQHVHDLLKKYETINPDLNIKSSSINYNESKKSVDNINNIEKYEKSIPKHGDEMFHNFIERIQMNPGQILRYCRDNSAPLLLSELSMPIRPCKYCGHDRIFELQILPTIIPKLKLNNNNNNNNFQLEFGTVLILTCSKSCWSLDDKYKEELVFLQAEKL